MFELDSKEIHSHYSKPVVVKLASIIPIMMDIDSVDYLYIGANTIVCSEETAIMVALKKSEYVESIDKSPTFAVKLW